MQRVGLQFRQVGGQQLTGAVPARAAARVATCKLRCSCEWRRLWGLRSMCWEAAVSRVMHHCVASEPRGGSP